MRRSNTFAAKPLLSASGLAVAAMLVSPSVVGTARAQSFQGTPDSTFGSVFVNNTSPGITDVLVLTPSAVINWIPNDTAPTGGPINFQPTGTTATFTNDPASTSDFMVLNRIIPLGSTRPIQFNGNVVSTLSAISSPSVPGGTVFFYSPGGILIGSTATFDIGNLVLTTSDLNYDSGGNFGSGNTFAFQPVVVPGSQIVVQAGAQITSQVPSSYIALVAPSVVNDGIIGLDGGAALVAADAATITFSPSSLFDIQVDSGTSATGTVLANNGIITGPASVGPANRIYMVAVPKNDAITMALGSGSLLGFDVAAAADVVGNAIVLSAGHDIAGGQIQTDRSIGGGDGLVSIAATDTFVTSGLTGRATGSINMSSESDLGLIFAGDTVLDAASGTSNITANAAGTVSIEGNLLFRGDITGTTAIPDATGVNVELRANDGGFVQALGDVTLSSIGSGGPPFDTAAPKGNGTGGRATIAATNGGTIAINGNANLTANGIGGLPSGAGPGGGVGAGGAAEVLALGPTGSSVQVQGNLLLDVSGFGSDGSGCVTCTVDGGDGFGGSATILASGPSSNIAVGLVTQATSTGNGGNGLIGAAGNGSGGLITVDATSGGTLDFHDVLLVTNAFGGQGPTVSGDATGGVIELQTTGSGAGGVVVNGSLTAGASAFGANGTGTGSTGGNALGGLATLLAADGRTFTITGDLTLNTNAGGGITYGASTAGTGGESGVLASTGGSVSVSGNASIVADGGGGLSFDLQPGGVGTGGLAYASVTDGSISFGGITQISSGGTGGDNLAGAQAGLGTGGSSLVVINGAGQINMSSDAVVQSTGRGGHGSGLGSVAGNGTGGSSAINLVGGTMTVGGNLDLTAEGYGGSADAVNGNGLGGLTTLSLANSNVTLSGTTYIGAVGSGASSFFEGSGGNGTGGTINFVTSDSSVLFSANFDVTFEASGFAGDGNGAGTGSGGAVAIDLAGSTITSPIGMSVFAEGQAGRGLVQSAGGVGIGGAITIASRATALGNGIIDTPTLAVSATGRGGTGASSAFVSGLFNSEPGGTGGAAQGGAVVLVAAADGGTISTSLLDVQADAVGGDGGLGFPGSGGEGAGGDGGAADGGSITLLTARTNGTGSGAFALDNGNFNARAFGGNGADAGTSFGAGPGGSGGNAQGGTIVASFDDGGSRIAATGGLTFSVEAFGGASGLCQSACLVAGGDALGGDISIVSAGLTSGNTIDAGFGLNATASASGGYAQGLDGAAGTAGTIVVQIGSGLDLSADQIVLSAVGSGGDITGSVTGGTGTGGNAQLIASGSGTVNAASAISIFAIGTGGEAQSLDIPGGNGGAGLGGTARLYSNGGAINSSFGANVIASGFGGAGDVFNGLGVGGNGTGGSATLSVGTPNELGNNGLITIGAATVVTAQGIGGDAQQGGDGTGGFAAVSARHGTVNLADTTVSTAGFGGFGSNGGAGGNGTGTTVQVVSDSVTNGPSQMTITTLNADASGFGGDGGAAGVPGGPGGNGGAATGGDVLVIGTAGNGNLSVTNLTAFAEGRAGNGGAGGIVGNGGAATGGGVQVGTGSGPDTGALNAGSAIFDTIFASASATGGSGSTGGNAAGGGALLLVRGSPVTINGTAAFAANATGGDGGNGLNDAGGNASVGNPDMTNFVSGTALVVSSRFNQPGQAGTLNTGDLQFTAVATGGFGTTPGTSIIAGDAIDIDILNSTVNGTNLSMFASADGIGPAPLNDFITVTNSSAAFSGSLLFSTPNTFSLTLDQSTLQAAQVTISAGNWVLGGAAPATLGTLRGFNALSLVSGLDLVANANLDTAGGLSLSALRDITFGDLATGDFVDIVAGRNLSLGMVTAGSTIDLDVLGTINTLAMFATDSITAQSQGSFTSGNLVAGSGTPTGANGDLNTVAITSGGNIVTGNVFAASDIGFGAIGSISTGTVDGFDGVLFSGGAIGTAGLNFVNRLLIADVSMVALGQTAGGFDKELVYAATPVATAGPVLISGNTAASSLRAATLADFTAGAIVTTDLVDVAAGGALTLGDVTSGAAIGLSSGTNTITQNMVAAGSITADSGGGFTSASLFAGSGTPAAANGDLNTVAITAGANIQTANIFAASDVRLVAPGAITTGTVNAFDVLALGGGAISLGSLGAVNRVLIADDAMAAPAFAAGGFDKELVFAATPLATSGTIALSGTANVGSIRGETSASILTGDINANGTIGFASGGNGQYGALRNVGGNINLIARSGGITLTTANLPGFFLASGSTGVNVGSVFARDIALLSTNTITAQTLLAGAVLSPTGAITGATGRTLLANSAMLPTGAMPGSINPNALFAATPIATGGSVSVLGAGLAGRFTSVSNGPMTGGTIVGFTTLDVQTGGLVTLRQLWGGPDVRIVSNDIAIIDNGSLTNPNGAPIQSGLRSPDTGSIELISTNSQPALIGDGLSGTGYSLSNAEIGLISGGELVIGATDIAANTVDMFVGNVTLTAGGAVGETVAVGPVGRIVFATGNPDTEVISGGIRVIGNVTGSGFAQSNVLEFSTGRFELDAATGAIALTSTGNALGGFVEFNADNVHIASSTILGQLAANPFYTGRIADLKAPAAVQRPGGVLRALGLDFNITGTLYIQNTGTTLVPAGFISDLTLTNVNEPLGAQPGSL